MQLGLKYYALIGHSIKPYGLLRCYATLAILQKSRICAIALLLDKCGISISPTHYSANAPVMLQKSRIHAIALLLDFCCRIRCIFIHTSELAWMNTRLIPDLYTNDIKKSVTV